MVDGALFSSESKLLLVRRLDGAWELPSSALEFGEEPEYCVARLFSETTGIDVTPDRPLGGWSLLESSDDNATRVHVVHIGFTVTLAGTLLGVELDAERYSAFAWVTQSELSTRLDSPQMLRVCERAFVALVRPRKK